MSETDQQPDKFISEELRKVLNSHGHGFHAAVLRRAGTLFAERRARTWVFDFAEFPVTAGNQTTHIDFILRSSESFREGVPLTYLIAECKRVNPALGRWCFARFPFTTRDASSDRVVVFEQFVETHPRTKRSYAYRSAYHLGFELRTGTKGEPDQKGRGALNDAVSQVLRGSNGLANYMFIDRSRLGYATPKRVVRFMPAIFTTAEIWVTDADLSLSSLATGELNALEATKQDWIWFNHNRSLGLRHDIYSRAGQGQIVDALAEFENEFTRSIAIVSPDGIDDFLNLDLHFMD